MGRLFRRFCRWDAGLVIGLGGPFSGRLGLIEDFRLMGATLTLPPIESLTLEGELFMERLNLGLMAFFGFGQGFCEDLLMKRLMVFFGLGQSLFAKRLMVFLGLGQSFGESLLMNLLSLS